MARSTLRASSQPSICGIASRMKCTFRVSGCARTMAMARSARNGSDSCESCNDSPVRLKSRSESMRSVMPRTPCRTSESSSRRSSGPIES